MIDYLDRNSKSNLLYASFIRVSFILRVNHCIEEKNSATLMGLIKTIPLRNLFLNQIIWNVKKCNSKADRVWNGRQRKTTDSNGYNDNRVQRQIGTETIAGGM